MQRFSIVGGLIVALVGVLLALPSQGASLDGSYPRLGNYLGTWYPLDEVSRFDVLITFFNDNGPVRAERLHELNPDARIVAYFLLEEVPSDRLDLCGEVPDPAWWLLRPYTLLSAPMDTSTTRMQVADPSRVRVDDDVLVDNEHMHVVSISGTVVTVVRNTGWPTSGPASHGVGARVAAHVSIWTQATGVRHWMLNDSAACPRDGRGRRWIDFLAAYIGASVLPNCIWDGIFLDQCRDSISWIESGNTDADSDGTADAGTGWGDGVSQFVQAIRAVAPSGFMVLRNNMGCQCDAVYNGGMFEHFSARSYYGEAVQPGRWTYLMGWYQSWEDDSRDPSVVLINGTTFNTGGIDLREMRFGLTSTLMGSGCYGYDFGDLDHGEPLWFDEFSVNPCGWPTHDDSGKGYLGQPLGPAYDAGNPAVTLKQAIETGVPNPESRVWRRDFEHGCALVNPAAGPRDVDLGRTYRKIRGIQDPTANDGSLVSTMTLPSYDGIILLDASTTCQNVAPTADAGPDQFVSGDSVLFEDDFESESMQDWGVDPRDHWSILLEGGNHVMHGQPQSWAGRDGAWADFSVSMRIKLVSGDGANCHFRETCTHYIVNFDAAGIGLGKGNWCLGQWESLDWRREDHEAGEWYTVEVVMKGQTIRVFLDRILKVEWQDREALPPGGISYWTRAAEVRLDDIRVGAVVQLNGGLSSDPNPGDSLTYHWDFLEKPPGSTAALSDAGLKDPTFVPDVSGVYKAELTVTDVLGKTDADEVMIFAGVGSAAKFLLTRMGDVRADSGFFGHSFQAGSADVAEWVPVSAPVESGEVLELDPNRAGFYREATGQCSSLVAGVVSSEPGIVLGGAAGAEERALLALSGIVPVRVTNEGGPIQPGDLLVSSSTPGCAMRWAGDGSCPCALVGKALEPMTDERGVISVLLTSH